MNIEVAKEILDRIDIKFFLSGSIEQSNYIVDKADEVNLAIETVLNELDKKDRQIRLMAEYIEEWTGSCPNDMYDWQDIDCEKECETSMKKCWIEYFYKKAGNKDV